MSMLQAAEYSIRLRHRHEDGLVGEFEPVIPHNSPADHDPERAWANGTVYKCTTCEEEVVVSSHQEAEDLRT